MRNLASVVLLTLLIVTTACRTDQATTKQEYSWWMPYEVTLTGGYSDLDHDTSVFSGSSTHVTGGLAWPMGVQKAALEEMAHLSDHVQALIGGHVREIIRLQESVQHLEHSLEDALKEQTHEFDESIEDFRPIQVSSGSDGVTVVMPDQGGADAPVAADLLDDLAGTEKVEGIPSGFWYALSILVFSVAIFIGSWGVVRMRKAGLNIPFFSSLNGSKSKKEESCDTPDDPKGQAGPIRDKPK